MAKLTKIQAGAKVLVELTRSESERLDKEGSIELGETIPFITNEGTVYLKPMKENKYAGKGVLLPKILNREYKIAVDERGNHVLILTKI